MIKVFLSHLSQLKQLKTTDNKSTLLHFVAGTVERKFPQVVEFAEDLSFTNAAARGKALDCAWLETDRQQEDRQANRHDKVQWNLLIRRR